MTAPPVDLAAVEARVAFCCTDDTGTEAPEPHVHMTAADRDALTKALRIAVEALTRMAVFDDEYANKRLEAIHSYAMFDEPGAVETSRESLRAISALVVIR